MNEDNKDIWSVDVLSKLQKQLTTSAGEDLHPRWSPDGQYIVFETERDGNREIYRMKPDGSEPENLTRNPGNDRAADWGICPP